MNILSFISWFGLFSFGQNFVNGTMHKEQHVSKPRRLADS